MAENEDKQSGDKRQGWRVFNVDYLRDPHDAFAGIVYALIGVFLLYAFFMAIILATRIASLMFDGHADEINKLLLALAGIIGAPLVVWRVMIAHRGNHIAQENLYTTLLTKAVEQLGATREEKTTRDVSDGNGGVKSDTKSDTVPNTEVRLGAIYALEKLAADYQPLHWPIMEILCAYVRKNAGPARPRGDEVRAALAKNEDERTKEEKALLAKRDNELQPPFVDVQAALTVIGRRSEARIQFEREQRDDSDRPANRDAWRLDLSGCHLAKVRLDGLNFGHVSMIGTCLEGASLSETRLEGSSLDAAHLERASLNWANLEEASLDGAHLEEALLFWANLEGASLFWAHLEGASLDEAHLEGASLDEADLFDARIDGANLVGANGLTDAQLDSCWGNLHTQLPELLKRPVNERWDDSDDRSSRWFARSEFWRAEARPRKA